MTVHRSFLLTFSFLFITLPSHVQAMMFQHLKNASGGWTVRDDVWVRYQREDQPLLAGPLAVGFSVYGDSHHFGPELQFGHGLGDDLENPVLLIKTAWGGKSLYRDFRPPASGGEVGKVLFVPTHDFVRRPEESPNPGHGHHEFGNAKTYFLVGDALGKGMIALLSSSLTTQLTLLSPLDYQVVQRQTRESGKITIAGDLNAADARGRILEARTIAVGRQGPWRKLSPSFSESSFQAPMDVPAGGWYRLEVRAISEGRVVSEADVAHLGVGEVFVVAGQSNSANHGAERQTSTSGRAATFDGQHWQLCRDPQPGASGDGGSFMPPFADAIVERFDVPVGLIACGIGATSVREWLPKASTFPHPPTIESRVQPLDDGQWQSNGEAFDMFVSRMTRLGPHGFRAVLWHQGESDANQRDPTRTLPGPLYREYLEKLIRDSRCEIGWDAPWFVAQVSYHVPGDEASPEIRAAQASLWKDGVALAGPDTDAIKGEFREAGGEGVHFSGAGLREHAARWVAKVAPWLEQQLK